MAFRPPTDFKGQKEFFEKNIKLFDDGTQRFADLKRALNWATDPTTSPDDIGRHQATFSRIFGNRAKELKRGVERARTKLADQFTAFANKTDFSNLSEEEAQKELAVLAGSPESEGRFESIRQNIQTLKDLGEDVSQFETDFQGIQTRLQQPASELSGTQFTPAGATRTDSGFQRQGELLPEQRSAKGRAAGRTSVEEQEDGTFAVVDADTGALIESGIGSQREALAKQTQLQSGSTGSIAGAPDVFSIDPETTAEKEAIESGEARVATPEELAAGEAESTGLGPTQVRNVEELERLAALGLSESDITRQGDAIFLNEGITADSLTQRGAVPPPSPTGGGAAGGQITAGTGAQVDQVPGGGFTAGGTGGPPPGTADIQNQQLAQQRTETLQGEIVGGGLTGVAAQEGQLLGTIGEGILSTEKALRDLPTTVQERTQNIGVTQGQLNKLVATESAPVAQALKDLLMSRSLLQEQIAFRRTETALEEERQEKSFAKLSSAGIQDEAFFGELDSAQGLPQGTHTALFNAQKASAQAAASQAELDYTEQVVGILGDIPLGEQVTIGGQTYTGLSMEGVKSGTEEDENGNLTYWQVDPRTGSVVTQDLGNIGKAAGWETVKTGDGTVFQVGPNGERRLIYNENSPTGFGAPGVSPGNGSGGYLDVFPGGSISTFKRANGKPRSECGEWVNDLTGRGLNNGSGVGDSYANKMGAMDNNDPSQVQVNDVFVEPYGSTGHIGFINRIDFDKETGERIFTVSESNYKKDSNGTGLITHNRQVRESEMNDQWGFTRNPGFADPSYNFGTDTRPSIAEEIENLPKRTEAQAKSRTFATRLDQALPIISELETQFSELGSQPGFVPRPLRSQDRKRFDQASGAFINALLRRESGAAISDEEFARFGPQFIPSPGDGPEVLAQKAEARNAELKNLVIDSSPESTVFFSRYPQFETVITRAFLEQKTPAQIEAAINSLL